MSGGVSAGADTALDNGFDNGSFDVIDAEYEAHTEADAARAHFQTQGYWPPGLSKELVSCFTIPLPYQYRTMHYPTPSHATSRRIAPRLDTRAPPPSAHPLIHPQCGMATILHLRVFSDAELLPLAFEALTAELGPGWEVVVAEKEPSLSLSLDREQGERLGCG